MKALIIICRRASDYLKPDCIRIHECAVCKLPLQMSHQAAAQVAKGAKPLCNPCGLTLAKTLGEKALLVVTPAAMDSMPENLAKVRADAQRRAEKN